MNDTPVSRAAWSVGHPVWIGLLLGAGLCSSLQAVESPEVLLEKYCVRCHGEEEIEADIDLRGPYTQLDLLKNADVWMRAFDQIDFGDMPPKKPLMTEAETDHLLNWIEANVTNAKWSDYHDPGRMSLSRLTAIEYRNSIRDILGVDLQAGRFLSEDPEGNTGFTNDRDALTFPLFAFDNFLREAEYLVDSYLNYAEPKWAATIDLVEALQNSDEGSVGLNESGDAVVLKEKNAPFQLNFTTPFAGLYRLSLEAATAKWEPVSAIHLMLNGQSVEDLVVEGESFHRYNVILNLPAGANVLSIGYYPDRAPVIQKSFAPREVPEAIEKKIRRTKIPTYPFPKHLEGNDQARKAWRKLNNTIQDFTFTQVLAEYLVKTGQLNYEMHHLTVNPTGPVQRFSPSKVHFNLAAGSVAVFSGIPQKELEKEITQVTGFRHEDYAKATRAFQTAWSEANPERVVLKPGQVLLKRAFLHSHAVPRSETGLRERVQKACSDEAAAMALLEETATRAFSRKPTEQERATLERIMAATIKETGSLKEGLRDALTATLVAPPFLLHYHATDQDPSQTTQVDSVTLSERLSRFLWLSIPDEELRELAAQDQLKEPAALTAAMHRMVEDRRFAEMASTFIDEWLDLENLRIHENSANLKAHMLAAMKQEPKLLFQHVFRENRSLLELVDPDYTFLNDSLALHYDVDGVKGQHMRKVDLGDRDRGGLLAMGSVLASTSTIERTSPVTRGAMIVELILGEELPPPPPSVPELQVATKTTTIREELERHRDDPSCSGCHEKIDPFGFVLEHYDQFGAWRAEDKGKPVNAATKLVDGTKVDGLVEFKNYLVEKREEDLLRNLTVRLFEFAVGREASYSDEATLREIMETVAADGYRARTLLREIILSDAFLQQVDTPPSARTVVTSPAG